MENRFLRRSFLFVPGCSEKMMHKAAQTDADALILDLEDSVAESEKEMARALVLAMMPAMRACGKEILVRVNALNSEAGIQDMLAAVRARPDALLIPKADARALYAADMLLEAMSGAECGPELFAQIETPAALMQIQALMDASRRIGGLVLGAEDLSATMGMKRTACGGEIFYARSMVACAGHACGLCVVDTPFTDIRDLGGLQEDAAAALSFGFTGKTCIHPAHIATINEIFSSSEGDLAHARELIEAYEAALAAGQGACMFEGRMVDKPVAERARLLLVRAKNGK